MGGQSVLSRRSRAVLAKALRERGLKLCPGCGRELPFAEFGSTRKRPYGRRWRCRACYNAYEVARRDRLKANDPDAVRARDRLANRKAKERQARWARENAKRIRTRELVRRRARGVQPKKLVFTQIPPGWDRTVYGCGPDQNNCRASTDPLCTVCRRRVAKWLRGGRPTPRIIADRDGPGGTERWCSGHNTWHPVEAFDWKSSARTRRHRECKIWRNRKTADYMRRRFQDAQYRSDLNRKRRARNKRTGAQAASVERRRLRMLGVPGTTTVGEKRKITRAYGGLCAVVDCDRPGHTWEHIIPISRLELDPTGWPWNVLPLCKSHNSAKRDRTPEEWLAKRGVALDLSRHPFLQLKIAFPA